MSQSASATLATATGESAVTKVGSGPLFIQGRALDAQGLPSGANMHLSSSNPAVAGFTTSRQRGNAPAGVIGIAAGTVTITATPSDNSGVSATLTVTVS
jgi:hypothetical protein